MYRQISKIGSVKSLTTTLIQVPFYGAKMWAVFILTTEKLVPPLSLSHNQLSSRAVGRTGQVETRTGKLSQAAEFLSYHFPFPGVEGVRSMREVGEGLEVQTRRPLYPFGKSINFTYTSSIPCGIPCSLSQSHSMLHPFEKASWQPY